MVEFLAHSHFREANGFIPSPSPTSSPTDLCLNDLVARAAFSDDSSSSEGNILLGDGKPRRKKGSLSLFDLQFADINKHYEILIFAVILIFIVLALCNTFMIYQLKRDSKIISNKRYGVINEKYIDDTYTDEEDL